MNTKQKRVLWTGAGIGLVLSLVVLGWRIISGKDKPVRAIGLHQAVSNVVQDAKLHIKGGVGVILAKDPTNGMMIVRGVLPGSPAEVEGLKRGDVVTHANGASLAGMPLQQAVESIRGVTGISLELTVLRPGESNALSIIIRRSSFKSLNLQP